jgi:hypothetical protein
MMIFPVKMAMIALMHASDQVKGALCLRDLNKLDICFMTAVGCHRARVTWICFNRPSTIRVTRAIYLSNLSVFFRIALAHASLFQNRFLAL